MEDKNVIITKTERSGKLCKEFERLFCKYGANVTHDTPEKHDLMMVIEQKLPTALSIVFASVITEYMKEHGIIPEDIKSHSTHTSIYPFLHMARIHSQHPRTYAEILTSNRESTEILKRFRDELDKLIELCEKGDIETLEQLMTKNSKCLNEKFLKEMLGLSLEVDSILSKPRK